jgi:UDP:flavonoid glycosyltransferase YjiC (YdhE family)
MRVLFATQPGHGHLNPMVPYAAALRDAGHEVRFATAPTFCAAVMRLGFDASPAGLDFSWERVTDTFPDMAQAATRGRSHVNERAQRIVWEDWTPPMVDDLLGITGEWHPDLIVREAAELGATLVGACAGIPVACAAWGAPMLDTAWERHLPMDMTWEGYAREARRLGVDPDGRAALRAELTLSTLPPSWMRAGDGELGEVEHYHAPPQDRSTNSGLSTELADLITRRFAYATLGTVHNSRHALRKTMLAALADLPVDVLFTAGPGIDLDRLGAQAQNITLESFVPQSLVVPHAALVVSHAGLGTVIGALYEGVPMVLISIATDHPINAERAVTLGVARTIDIAECEPEQLRAQIMLALADGHLRERATEISDECRSLPEIGSAAQALESYASRT